MVEVNFISIYEARTLFELAMPRYQPDVVSDSDTYNYSELCNFFQIIIGIGVDASVVFDCMKLFCMKFLCMPF